MQETRRPNGVKSQAFILVGEAYSKLNVDTLWARTAFVACLNSDTVERREAASKMVLGMLVSPDHSRSDLKHANEIITSVIEGALRSENQTGVREVAEMIKKARAQLQEREKRLELFGIAAGTTLKHLEIPETPETIAETVVGVSEMLRRASLPTLLRD
jgi:hypothetical protein